MMTRTTRVLIGTVGVLIGFLVLALACNGLGGLGTRLAERRDRSRPQPAPRPILAPTPSRAPLTAGRADLPTTLGGLDGMRTMSRLLAMTGLTAELGDQNTLFAPTDAAFAALPEPARVALQERPDALAALLRAHVAPEIIPANAIAARSALPTRAGTSLPVAVVGGVPQLAGAAITAIDIPFDKGLIHLVDQVLLPPTAEPPPVIAVDPAATLPLTFQGSYLTVVGTAAPGTLLMLQINDNLFGSALATAEGTWLVAGGVLPGTYRFVAYTADAASRLPLARSAPVTVIVTAE